MRGPLTLILLLAGSPMAAPVPRARAVPAELIIEFVSADPAGGVRQVMGDAAVLEVGQLSAARGAARTRAARDGHGHAQSIVDRRQIAVRLRSASGRARFARLQASLKVEDPRCRVRIDGIVLTQVPQLIDAAAPVGAAVAHTLEIEVPVSEPPGVLATEITWLADTDS